MNSKELEALNKIDETLCDIEIKHKENLGHTKPLTRTIEKSLKALEIIKKKNVAVAMLKSCGTVKRYNAIALDEECFKDKDYARKLTEEEYDLLKEVLE